METFGIKLRVSTQKDFDKLRALALISQVIDRNEIKQFMYDTFDEYYLENDALQDMKEKVRDNTMHHSFSIWEQDAYDWWYMYCYASVMGWVNNAFLPGYDRTFEHTTDVAVNKFEKTMSNQSIALVREEVKQLSEEVSKNPPQVEHNGEKLKLHVQFMWQSREDNKVCSVCNELEGQMMWSIPGTMPHLNCRCDFVVYEWWTNEQKEVVADRRYEIEQNKQYKGHGYSVKKAKVVSQLQDGEQVTIFEVLKDGKTHRTTFKNKDLERKE